MTATNPPDDDTSPAAPLPDPALERVLRASRGMVDASPEVQARAMAIFGAGRVAPVPGPSLVQRLAQLVFDSLAPGDAPFALGVRGEGGFSRQWLFRAGDHDIDLQLDHDGLPGDRPWRLAGQVLGPEGAVAARLVGDTDPAQVFQALLGEQADFRLDRLPPGRWRLHIDFDAWSIVLPVVEWPAA